MARVLRPHGVRGELVCELISEFPERFRPGVRVYVGAPDTETAIQSARLADRTVTLGLRDVTSRAQAEQLRDAWILVAEQDAHPLPEGRYYWHQLIGLQVVTDAGRPLGELVDILETGSNDVYVVRGDAREMLLPVIPEVVLDIDLERRLVTVHLLPGLDEL